MVDFSECGKEHYHQGLCYHLHPFDEGNPLNHPLKKKVVDIKEFKLHNATSIQFSLNEILSILNDHREEGFVPYDTNNWLDGLLEWTYLRLPEWKFYPMFAGAIDLGHGISRHDEERAKEEKRMKHAYPMGKPNIVRQYIAKRRVCSCERHRREIAKKGGYYGR